ncbi:hypothetical protein CU098_003315 [Rhizopus stolonifer]|uniref:DDRGK domain-containing protein 1 n=1 Tax=Rhizopus stolonifer TaxID=4846 RepID=A0A367K7E5_RHIST|nr:hypothetical protein CU098_003315 [Rhizopus stolonifer]
MTNKEKDGLPLIVFIPIIICAICILVLLDIRKKRNDPQINDDQDHVFDETNHPNVSSEEDNGEGSSTAVRVKKIGKKRGEKLKRKEQMRQYREYMDQQREIRRAQEEIAEEEFRRKRIEDSIKRQDELQKLRKEKEKKAKQEQKEELKKQQLQEKDAKKKQARFGKYSHKVKQWVKDKKLCDLDQLSASIGLEKQDIIDILKQLTRLRKIE